MTHLKQYSPAIKFCRSSRNNGNSLWYWGEGHGNYEPTNQKEVNPTWPWVSYLMIYSAWESQCPHYRATPFELISYCVYVCILGSCYSTRSAYGIFSKVCSVSIPFLISSLTLSSHPLPHLIPLFPFSVHKTCLLCPYPWHCPWAFISLFNTKYACKYVID